VLPAQDPKAGEGQPRERLANEARHRPQILADDAEAAPGFAGDGEQALTKRDLGSLVAGMEDRRAADRALVDAVVPDDVIEAHAVEEVGGATAACPPPRVVALGHDLPAHHRKSPVLSFPREGVR